MTFREIQVDHEATLSPEPLRPVRCLLGELSSRLAEAHQAATGIAAASIEALQADIQLALETAGLITDSSSGSSVDCEFETTGLDDLPGPQDSGPGATSSNPSALSATRHGRFRAPERRTRDAGES